MAVFDFLDKLKAESLSSPSDAIFSYLFFLLFSLNNF